MGHVSFPLSFISKTTKYSHASNLRGQYNTQLEKGMHKRNANLQNGKCNWFSHAWICTWACIVKEVETQSLVLENVEINVNTTRINDSLCKPCAPDTY